VADDTEIRALAKRFFDAVERGDIGAVSDCYAPEARIWHNTDGVAQTRDENLEVLRGFVSRISDRVYADRRLAVFDGGFVHQHELRGVRQDGVGVKLAACVVCGVADGKITRLEEYFDSAQVAVFRQSAETTGLQT
jgi:ketosteroid isomerase-like protein